MGTFLLDKSVTADLGTMKDRGAVRRAVERFYRDLDMVTGILLMGAGSGSARNPWIRNSTGYWLRKNGW